MDCKGFPNVTVAQMVAQRPTSLLDPLVVVINRTPKLAATVEELHAMTFYYVHGNSPKIFRY